MNKANRETVRKNDAEVAAALGAPKPSPFTHLTPEERMRWRVRLKRFALRAQRAIDAILIARQDLDYAADALDASHLVRDLIEDMRDAQGACSVVTVAINDALGQAETMRGRLKRIG